MGLLVRDFATLPLDLACRIGFDEDSARDEVGFDEGRRTFAAALTDLRRRVGWLLWLEEEAPMSVLPLLGQGLGGSHRLLGPSGEHLADAGLYVIGRRDKSKHKADVDEPYAPRRRIPVEPWQP